MDESYDILRLPFVKIVDNLWHPSGVDYSPEWLLLLYKLNKKIFGKE